VQRISSCFHPLSSIVVPELRAALVVLCFLCTEMECSFGAICGAQLPVWGCLSLARNSNSMHSRSNASALLLLLLLLLSLAAPLLPKSSDRQVKEPHNFGRFLMSRAANWTFGWSSWPGGVQPQTGAALGPKWGSMKAPLMVRGEREEERCSFTMAQLVCPAPIESRALHTQSSRLDGTRSIG